MKEVQQILRASRCYFTENRKTSCYTYLLIVNIIYSFRYSSSYYYYTYVVVVFVVVVVIVVRSKALVPSFYKTRTCLYLRLCTNW